ncbi:MAG: 7-cyano-7-deazaguanine synthase [archaeon YNP-LCB-003-016]|uniref:7-cyano-7-deazaguanine synthase n=1 Tax=Candidatus Culexarchaeum yellowstonense TaxID=2928963 RepID=UPI0026EAE649|nr:7-cyano-7-deazaguanine synthase [Candidatus Culexarchaeum yellowstonense]MCR6693138.1 7-cyano-7-deazaguanine synthase [Candidatus Culexarchaeum yellowstonense]
MTIGAGIVIYGAQLDDIAPRGDAMEPRFPDNTPDTARAFEEVVRVAHFPVGERKIEIWSPAREGLSKSENLKRGYEIAGDLIFETWSCYLSGEAHCGNCDSCRERHRAFIEAGIADRTIYNVHPIVSDKCRLGKCGVR